MVALMEVYQEEDEAYQELVTVATMFFQYLLQPFRDMREVATSCKLDILVCFLYVFIFSDLLVVTFKIQSVFAFWVHS